MMDDLTLIQRIVVWILPVIFAITGHEVAHGWVAKKLGDKTASQQGRLTLNPIKHVDIFGTIIIPGLLLISSAGFIFGWAKPVPVDPRYFKKPRRDMAIVAVAGPVSNLLMAFVWAMLVKLGIELSMEWISLPLILAGMAGIKINLVLALINLIPIPPLDGSRIVTGFLPNQLAWQYNKLERYGFFILIALLWTGALSYILGYPMSYMFRLFASLAGM